jgi:transposase
MDARELKGMQIAATMPLRRDSSGWIVPSQSGAGTYRVSPHPTTTAKVAQGVVPPPPGVQPWNCTCPDFELRRMACKHVIAVEFVVRREHVYPDGTVVTEEAKTRITYTQNWPAYNAAQCAESDLFPSLLQSLCGTLERPYGGKGRPRLPLSDIAFDCVSKVYSGLSARRHDGEVRDAKEQGLTETDPSFNTVLRHLRDPELTPHLQALVRLSATPLAAVETTFAPDATGFSTCTYARWYDHKWGKEKKVHEYVKLHAMTGVKTNVVTDARVTDYRVHDSKQFVPLLDATVESFNVQTVVADKGYSTKAIAQAVVDRGATPYIPFREIPTGRLFNPNMATPPANASAWDRMYHQFALQRDTFLVRYHVRSNVESTFSMIKRKFGESLKSKSYQGQVNEVLCKVVAHNLCCLISAIYELGLEMPQFSQGPHPALVG